MDSHVHGCGSCHPGDGGVLRAPAVVRAWLEAHAAHDVDGEVSALCEDVVVAADGRLFLGRAAAGEWSRQATGSECLLLGVSCVTRGDASVVTLRFEGPSPSTTTEVTYCFLLSGDLIRGLAVAA